MKTDFTGVTEFSGEAVPREQFERLCHRYIWCSQFCENKDVLEIACGTGFGSRMLSKISSSYVAGDYQPEIVEIAKKNTENKIEITVFDAVNIPYDDDSKDVIILFEAIYYIKNVDKFFYECKRVLRPGGIILIATANKDLYDFNPSPFSHKYFGVREFKQVFGNLVWESEFYAYLDTNEVSIKQKIFRPIKALASKLNLIPKTMNGKRFLKKMVFGKLVNIPKQLELRMIDYTEPLKIDHDKPNMTHKVIYAVAKVI